MSRAAIQLFAALACAWGLSFNNGGMDVAEAINVQGLTKIYKGALGETVTAVDNLSFEVQQGEIFGFIGPNGAGKTTTIKTLLGLCFPPQEQPLCWARERATSK